MYPGAGPVGGMPPNQPGQHGMGPSPMNTPMQQQRRIDPDQMPSPVSTILFLSLVFKKIPIVGEFLFDYKMFLVPPELVLEIGMAIL